MIYINATMIYTYYTHDPFNGEHLNKKINNKKITKMTYYISLSFTNEQLCKNAMFVCLSVCLSVLRTCVEQHGLRVIYEQRPTASIVCCCV